MVTGRLYRTVLCRCHDNRSGRSGSDAAVGGDAQQLNPTAVPSATRRNDMTIVDDDDDDEDGDPAAPRLRFEISFHRPCGSLRRRQRRHAEVQHVDEARRRNDVGPGETIELDMTQFVASVADDKS